MAIFARRVCDTARVIVSAAAPFLVLLAALSLVGGVRYPAIIAAAALIHEAGHVLAAWALRVPISPNGAAPGFSLGYDCGGKSYFAEAAICLAGPALGFASAVLAGALGAARYRGGMFFIMSSAAIAAFNLLPSASLDGGGVLRALLHRFTDCRRADCIADAVSAVTAVAIAVAVGVAAVAVRANLSLVLIAVYVLWRDALSPLWRRCWGRRGRDGEAETERLLLSLKRK